jgi:hypothetical protein
MSWHLYLEFSGKIFGTKENSSFAHSLLLKPFHFASRDSFANIVDLLDDMFERCANADEPSHLNFVKKHAEELKSTGVSERTAARLFSNP